MRMWLCDCKIMCRQHLLGEHNEHHAFYGHIKLKRKVNGYIANNLLEPLSLNKRHDELVIEMIRRGYNHNSPFMMEEELLNNLPIDQLNHVIDRDAATVELLGRCPECRNNFIKEYGMEKYLHQLICVCDKIQMPMIKNFTPTLIIDELVEYDHSEFKF